jgi:hypothetical protein
MPNEPATPLPTAAAAPNPNAHAELMRKLLELKEAGLMFGDAMRVFGVERDSSPYGRAAFKHYRDEGELEFDDNLVVSEGGDPGAYVLAWRWVSDDLLEPTASAG